MSNTSQLRLSVLDQCPVPSGFTPTDALANSLSLAQHVDKLGYTRLWYSEHHGMDLLACTAPEILITRAAAATQRIRVGSGGIMLPHYAPLKVAEVFRTLHAMFPNRIDLGLGRAPGGGQLNVFALRRDRTSPYRDDFPQQLAELRAFLDPTRWSKLTAGTLFGTDDQAPHPFSAITVAPDSPGAPDLWLLGSSLSSAILASQQALPYAYAHFFSPVHTRRAIEHYQENFQPSAAMPHPEATLAIGVICAPTEEEAEYLSASVRLLQRRIQLDDRRPVATPDEAFAELERQDRNKKSYVPNPLLPYTLGSFDAPEDNEWPRYLVGTPEKVARQLRGLASELHLNEIIVNTITHSHEARLRSYQLLADAMELA